MGNVESLAESHPRPRLATRSHPDPNAPGSPVNMSDSGDQSPASSDSGGSLPDAASLMREFGGVSPLSRGSPDDEVSDGAGQEEPLPASPGTDPFASDNESTRSGGVEPAWPTYDQVVAVLGPTCENDANFCLHCVRTCLKQFKVAVAEATRLHESFAPFEISCRPVATSVLCEQCKKRKDLCEPTAAIMAGDAIDMITLLDYARTFWRQNTREDLERGLEPATRVTVANAVIELVAAFEASEKSCRTEHGLTAAKKNRDKNAYNALLETRENNNVARSPRPRRARKIPAWEIEIALRLKNGDQGYTTWKNAKRYFLRRIREAIRAEVIHFEWSSEDHDRELDRVPIIA
ncbi:hypothetical protein SUNI508_09891 [Seiridium unicorne]|uniref:Uncharacterized protein n=1 Tax=Seiridium unicorne TaxID=138068 RepID=A0ABR2UNA8_9PEZI